MNVLVCAGSLLRHLRPRQQRTLGRRRRHMQHVHTIHLLQPQRKLQCSSTNRGSRSTTLSNLLTHVSDSFHLKGHGLNTGAHRSVNICSTFGASCSQQVEGQPWTWVWEGGPLHPALGVGVGAQCNAAPALCIKQDLHCLALLPPLPKPGARVPPPKPTSKAVPQPVDSLRSASKCKSFGPGSVQCSSCSLLE